MSGEHDNVTRDSLVRVDLATRSGASAVSTSLTDGYTGDLDPDLAGIGIAAAGIATSSFRITWLVPDVRVQEAVRALHARYIEQQRPLLP